MIIYLFTTYFTSITGWTKVIKKDLLDTKYDRDFISLKDDKKIYIRGKHLYRRRQFLIMVIVSGMFFLLLLKVLSVQ